MTKNQPQKIIVILGQTASGKSDLGIKIAKKFNGEIISADSRQVYKGMDIGTGKVTKQEQKVVKHHMRDVANPRKEFTVYDFKKIGEKAIKNILAKNKLPIIVGGSGFYIDSLVKNLALPEVPPNKKLRAKLVKQSMKQLFSQLLILDPQRAKTIDPKNKLRLIRALEIIKTTGKTIPSLKESSRYNVLYFGIKWSKEALNKRIKIRLNKRLRQGMIEEVKKLLNPPTSRGLGKKRLYNFGLEYRWINEYLSGKINYSQMENGLFKAIVKYSKRQLTWFKRNKKIHWLVSDEKEKIKDLREPEKLIRKFLN